MVPTTSERLAGSATNGVVSARFSAQLYRAEELAVVRSTMPARPPFSFIHLTWFSSMSRVPTAGVL